MKIDKMAIAFIFIAVIMLSGCSNDLQTEYPDSPDQSVPVTDDVPSPPSLVPIAEDIPESIVTSANNVIISKVGKENFESYHYKSGIYYEDSDFKRFSLPPTYYFINYIFEPYELEMSIMLDPQGSSIPVKPVPLPDCISDPRECIFIDKSTAIANARAVDMSVEDDQPFPVRFAWDYQVNSYVWIVSGKPPGSLVPGGCLEWNEIVVDANSGEIADIRKGGLCT